MDNKAKVGIGVGLAILSIFLVFGFFSEPDINNGSRVRVSTSFYPLYFLAKGIAGDKAEVINITPTGVEPHDYELTAKEITTILNSDLLILNGGGFEAWAEDIHQNKDIGQVFIIEVAKGLENNEIEENGEMIPDPHVWLSPPLVKKMSQSIFEGLKKVDPINSSYYEDNWIKLQQQIDEIHRKYVEGLRDCEKSDIITSHAAFGYLADTYGFNQVSITGISPDAEPSSKELGELATFARNGGIKYIFFESLVSPKLAETLAREVGAKTLVLNPIEGLTSEEIVSGENYLTVMEKNLENLKIALECK